jgi:hypothetical protein
MDSDTRSEAHSSQNSAFKEFCEDRESIRSLGVTTPELEALSRASLLGTLSSKEDVLFMLRQIREKEKPARVESSMPDAVQDITEKLRRNALTNMKKRDARDARRNSPLWRRVRKMLGQDGPLPADDSTGD